MESPRIDGGLRQRLWMVDGCWGFGGLGELGVKIVVFWFWEEAGKRRRKGRTNSR